MIKLEKSEMHLISDLCSNTSETLILSCLQGHMGDAWVDNILEPKIAIVITADFCFITGDSSINNAYEMVRSIPLVYKSDYIIIAPADDEWCSITEKVFDGAFDKFTRYAFYKDNSFDKKKLLSYISILPNDYILMPIDESIFNITKQEPWAYDLCSQFKNYEDYKNRGIGYVIMYNNELVCGASSYTVYNNGIEIQIDTKQDFKQKGLATACASKLILECLNKNIYPSWDAANLISVKLAQKLGYIFKEEYIAYGINLKKIKDAYDK